MRLPSPIVDRIIQHGCLRDSLRTSIVTRGGIETASDVAPQIIF